MQPCCRAQDKHILETAYRQDMKPDKAKRLAIVKQVSLNEKEVQVCFFPLCSTSVAACKPFGCFPKRVRIGVE